MRNGLGRCNCVDVLDDIAPRSRQLRNLKWLAAVSSHHGFDDLRIRVVANHMDRTIGKRGQPNAGVRAGAEPASRAFRIER